MIPIFDSQQIRAIEKLAYQQNITPELLMQRAGQAAFDCFRQHWPQAKKIVIFCGGGNNGGDGYVFAQLAYERGLQVLILQVGEHNKQSSEAHHAYSSCKKSGVPIKVYPDLLDWQSFDVIIDALCGIGVEFPLREELISVIQAINESLLPVLSLDVPSGINADTGDVNEMAVKATVTITFIAYKLGLLTGPAVSYVGKLNNNDLALSSLLINVPAIAQKLAYPNFKSYLTSRPRDFHKGKAGHVLIIGGDEGYAGAVSLAGEGALRVGAGLVTIATHPDHAHAVSINRPEIMARGIHNINQLESLLSTATVIILGPGLGQSEWSTMIWNAAITSDKAMIVDADGLNLLALAPQKKSNWILTPHPGEAARFLGVTVKEIQADRLAALVAMQKNLGGICLLKGAGTLIMSDNQLPFICTAGNPGMSTAGMGDLLSGILGGLVAQHLPLDIAAQIGVLIHAMAGDMAAKLGERGMIASDLLPHLRSLCNNN